MRLLLLLALVCLPLTIVVAQERESNAKKADARKNDQKESQALAFVDKNHPELAAMLPKLKKSHPREYQSAIRDLASSQQRLDKLAQRDKASHAIELKIWQLNSRVRLLAAQLTMGADREKLTKEIREVLAERTKLELRRKELQRDQFKKRYQQLETEVDRLKSRQEQRIDLALDKILATVDKQRNPPKSQPKRDPPKSAKPGGGKGDKSNAPAKKS